MYVYLCSEACKQRNYIKIAEAVWWWIMKKCNIHGAALSLMWHVSAISWSPQVKECLCPKRGTQQNGVLKADTCYEASHLH
jgi:hypothetical protein